MFVDTGIMIRGVWRSTAEHQALERMLNEREELFASAIAWAEFTCGKNAVRGPQEVAHVRSLLSEVVPASEEEADLAAELYNQTGRRKGTLPDCMIAATAILRKEPLLTIDEGFKVFEALGLELA